MSRHALAPGHAREYETIYVLRPNIDKEVAGEVASRVAEAIKGNEGKLTQAELWGQRRLAYPIARHFRGTYVYVKYLGKGPAVSEVERQLSLVDSVIRYQTVQLRDNVPVETVQVSEEDLALDFDLPFEADEPELPRERELGLDTPPGDRRRRDDRDRRDDFDEGFDDDGDGDDGEEADS
jgi:small subunit ribosomal protein S6